MLPAPWSQHRFMGSVDAMTRIRPRVRGFLLPERCGFCSPGSVLTGKTGGLRQQQEQHRSERKFCQPHRLRPLFLVMMDHVHYRQCAYRLCIWKPILM